MVERTRFDVTLNVHCLSCYNIMVDLQLLQCHYTSIHLHGTAFNTLRSSLVISSLVKLIRDPIRILPGSRPTGRQTVYLNVSNHFWPGVTEKHHESPGHDCVQTSRYSNGSRPSHDDMSVLPI